MARVRLRGVSDVTAWDAEDDAGGEVAVTRCDHGGTWLVALRGEHDLTTVPSLERATRDVWPTCRIAVVDLSGVTFIDSTVVSWLLRVERALEEGEGFTLSIVTGPPGCFAARFFEQLRMDNVLACYATRRDALMQSPAVARTVAVRTSTRLHARWKPSRIAA